MLLTVTIVHAKGFGVEGELYLLMCSVKHEYCIIEAHCYSFQMISSDSEQSGSRQNLTKTFVVETLYHCNYCICSLSLLIKHKYVLLQLWRGRRKARQSLLAA